MRLLYTLGIYLYYLLVNLAAPFNNKARLWLSGRKGQFKRMQQEITGDEPLAWFHASSLGEFEQGRPIMEAWKKQCPDLRIVLTFFSPSGYEIRKNYEGADHIYYLPLDTRYNARRFLDIVKPDYAVFIKYEFWYHFLKQSHKRGTKLVLASAIFRSGQLFFKPYGAWYRNLLRNFDHLFVQDENSMNLLKGIGIEQCSLAGDTRFDRVAQIARQAEDIPVAETFSDGYFTYVFGSTWDKDEEHIIRYIKEHPGDARFIIAPHEIDEPHIRQLQEVLPGETALLTDGLHINLSKARVLIVNTIGQLSAIYRYGSVAYIGGGFGAGIHNILEPAVYGMPVFFGPRYQKFREAVKLVKEGGAFSYESYSELKTRFDMLESTPDELTRVAECTRDFVQQNMGATERILAFLTGDK